MIILNNHPENNRYHHGLRQKMVNYNTDKTHFVQNRSLFYLFV